MKKVSVFVLTVFFVGSLVGCSVPVPVADSGTEDAPSSSVVMDTASIAPASSAEPTETETTKPEQVSSVEAGQPASSGGGSSSTAQPSGSGPSSSSSTAQPPASSQPPATSQSPAPPQPQTPPPASSQEPAPAEPPAAKTAYDAPYNTGTIITDAQSYGASIGMTWSEGLNKDNCSWEAPIATSSVLCGDRLKEAIESGIRRVQKLQQDNGYQPGEFHFKLLLEASGGEYTLYFLMG